MKQSRRPRLTTRNAVRLGCLMAVLGPALLLAWGVYSYYTAPQPSWSVAWSPDGKTLAAGFGIDPAIDLPNPPPDDTVHVWDIMQLDKPKEVLTGHSRPVRGLAFSPDGLHLATGDEAGHTLLWDAHDLSSRPIVMNTDLYPATGSRLLVFSPDGRWLVGTGNPGGEVGVWDITHPLAPRTGLIAPGAYIGLAGFLPDNKTVVAVSEEGRVGLWDSTSAGGTPTLLPRGGIGVSSIALSKDGRQIAGAGQEGVLWLWDLRHPDAQPMRLPGKLAAFPLSLDFSPDGRRLVAGARDEQGNGKTLVWDLADKGKEPGEVRGAVGQIFDLKFSPDGKWLASSGGYDGPVRLWSADDLGSEPRLLGR